MGALWPLAEPEAWQEYGDMTPAEAATMMQDILWAVMLAEDVCAIAETPYWDTAANVDDTLPEGSETWYGQIVPTPSLLASDDLTFLDNLGIWAIAGFIAYAGLPGAAIAFVPVAQRFVLAFKQHDLGAIVHVLIDFAEIAEIDTHGVTEGILNLNVVMPDDGMDHTLYVMVDQDNPEGNFAQIVRKELSPAQVTPTSLRWNPDTNTVQQTPDGGSTWIDNPSADPRAGAGFQLPPRGGSDPQCNAAENMTVKLKGMVNIFEAELSQLQSVNALVDLVLVFLPEVGIVLEALLAATELVLTIGSSAISAAFTDDQWDIVKCILYCDIASDGTVDQTRFDKILDDMHIQNSTVVYDVLYTLFTLSLGVNGITNAGATGDAVGDCSGCACEWCYEWDFTLSDGGFAATVIDGIPFGTYAAGVGWQPHIQDDGCSNHAYTYLLKDLGFTADNIAGVEYEFAIAEGDFDVNFFDQNVSGTIVQRTTLDNGSSTIHQATMTPVSLNQLGITLNRCGNPEGWTQTKARVSGFGDMPAFTGGSVCP